MPTYIRSGGREASGTTLPILTAIGTTATMAWLSATRWAFHMRELSLTAHFRSSDTYQTVLEDTVEMLVSGRDQAMVVCQASELAESCTSFLDWVVEFLF